MKGERERERVWSIQELCIDDDVLVYDVTRNWRGAQGKICCVNNSFNADKFVLYIGAGGHFERFNQITNDMLQRQLIHLYKLV